MRRLVVAFTIVVAIGISSGTSGFAVAYTRPADAPAEILQADLNADFNNDGFADLAVGAPGESIGSSVNAGAVNVLYGSATGSTGTGSQFFTQDTSGVGSTAEAGDTFGSALGVGDFNNDGFADLAIGAAGESSSRHEVGAVNVLYGSAAGLTGTGSQFFTQDTSGVGSTAEAGDFFGSALGVGDFNNDGFADLGVGVEGESIGSSVSAGAVNVLYGSAAGLSGTGSQFFTQDSPGVGSSAEAGDFFGSALGVGDFDNNGFADLAVGVPFESIGSRPEVGAVNVLPGSAAGLTGTGSLFLTQDSPGVGSSAETNDSFGFTVAVGDFDNNGFADLAVGVPFESIGSLSEVGAVNVLLGSAAGLTGTGSLFLTQDSPGVGSSAETNDSFGFAVAAGDFDNNGFADLAVGVPFESIGSLSEVGAVNVLPGSAAGVTGTGSLFLTQDSPGVGSSAEEFDWFGFAVSAGDFDNDGFADLAVGVPFESIGSLSEVGAVNVLPGSAAGVTGTGSLFLTQDSPGVGSSAEESDGFGFALATSGAQGSPAAQASAALAATPTSNFSQTKLADR